MSKWSKGEHGAAIDTHYSGFCLSLAAKMLARRKDSVSFRIWTERRAADVFIDVERR